MSHESLELILGITQGLALTMSVTFVTYVGLIVFPFLRHKPAATGDPDAFEWHFLVPCRDEEAVIDGTVRYLRGTFPATHIWVLDDASDDQTAHIVRHLRGHGPDHDQHIHLVTRRRPDARTGKGDALNTGYRSLIQWRGRQPDPLPPDRVVVIVVDADGRPAPNCLAVCAADHLFGDLRIGAVQIEVWMSNRNTRPPRARISGGWFFRGLLVRMQDLEFRTALSAIQMTRGMTGTIAMGGNGQFTRLSTLDSIAGSDGRPWLGSLLEDYELGVHLLTAGWRTGFTTDTHVAQEALYSLRRFLAQRTRWGQGTMQCARYLRQIWSSPHITTLGAAEMTYYLAQPWIQLLGTIVYPVPFVLLGIRTIDDPKLVWTWLTDDAWILFLMYGCLGLLPFVIWGPIYRSRCERTITAMQAFGYGLTFAVYVYCFYITSWRALYRIITHRHGWTKTRRNAETHNPNRVATDH